MAYLVTTRRLASRLVSGGPDQGPPTPNEEQFWFGFGLALVNFRFRNALLRGTRRLPSELGIDEKLNICATFVVDYGCSYYILKMMKAFPISTRYTASELKQLDRTAKAVQMSRSELIHARSLGKVVTTHELADWAEAGLAKNAQGKTRRVSHAA
jgi:hypothetical protein